MYNSPNSFPRDLRILALLQAWKGSVRGEHQKRDETWDPTEGWALSVSVESFCANK